MFYVVFCWFIIFFLLLFMIIKKFNFFLLNFFKFVCFSFEHQGLQSSLFFKFSIFFLIIFWVGGLFFPLFSPWSSIIYLFFFTVFSWLGVRTLTLLVFSFNIMFEEEIEWSWLTSLFMFFSHWLSFLMSGVALCLRISIIFLIGHFMMFFFLDFSFFFSYVILFVVVPLEFFFAFLQSYIFLVLISMFLLNMI
uniref:ATP synthase F0 subunit 6 n=1 Tax=Neofoleyellides sp. XM-2022 TaxID=3014012 RepID=A0A9E9JK44_9BILA|nr:ATP synthase F0 subunit 6 [Neofoleyellides sp. XM-2022]